MRLPESQWLTDNLTYVAPAWEGVELALAGGTLWAVFTGRLVVALAVFAGLSVMHLLLGRDL